MNSSFRWGEVEYHFRAGPFLFEIYGFNKGYGYGVGSGQLVGLMIHALRELDFLG